MSAPPDAQAELTIDLGALAANWRLLRAQAAPAECGAVVKANAYGIGIEQAVPALARAGCRTFFTAHVSEGVRARASLREAGVADQDSRIFILNGFHPATPDRGIWREFALSAVIGSASQLEAWTALVASGGDLACALHVDTGMNRFGLGLDEALGLGSNALAAARVGLLMSHFVSAEEPDNPINAAQIARFEQARRGPLKDLPASLANSSGIFLASRPHYDLVRPGYALYGGNPRPGLPNPMRPVVSLHARVLQTRWIAPGETAGYGGLWTARRATCLATLGVGYADGLLRNARTLGTGDGPVALLGGVPCPLVGRVSMDLSLVDVTDAPEGTALEGARVELLGPGITVDDLGRQTGTIGYEVLTSLGHRYLRRTTDSETAA